MDLLTFFVSRPPEELVEGAQYEVLMRDGSTRTITVGKRVETEPVPAFQIG
jgi:hypothetical protein